ncbi:hypothetical protein VCHA40P240_60115 [Vibrio chagasii]|nr:hypothetical protein VCHA40P240_60115 [Vibrio chagasii]
MMLRFGLVTRCDDLYNLDIAFNLHLFICDNLQCLGVCFYELILVHTLLTRIDIGSNLQLGFKLQVKTIKQKLRELKKKYGTNLFSGWLLVGRTRVH